MEMTADELRAFVSCKTVDEVKKPFVGCWVIVRCRDAGVHAGLLEDYNGREARLTESRRLWYWKPAHGAKFLSGVAAHGLHNDSKIGEPIHIVLTETCEIILCSDKAAASIQGMESDKT